MGVLKKIYQSGKVSWFIDYYDVNGKRTRKSFPTKRQAENALAHYKNQRFEEKIMGVKRNPKFYFSEMIEKYLEYSRVTFSLDSHSTNIAANKSFSPFLENKFIDEISLNDIEEYKTYRLQVVKPATLNRNLTTLKRKFNLACEWEMASKLSPIKSRK